MGKKRGKGGEIPVREPMAFMTVASVASMYDLRVEGWLFPFEDMFVCLIVVWLFGCLVVWLCEV